MKGIGREIVLVFFVAIVLFLLLGKGADTVNIINAIGGQISNSAATLQGRGSGGTGA